MLLEETDIQVFDTETGAVTNLTEDGVDGGLLSREEWAAIDLAPVWLDNGTLRFIRYTQDDNPAADASLLQSISGAVIEVQLPADGEMPVAQPVMDLPWPAAWVRICWPSTPRRTDGGQPGPHR